jgi:hypothetical protein
VQLESLRREYWELEGTDCPAVLRGAAKHDQGEEKRKGNWERNLKRGERDGRRDEDGDGYRGGEERERTKGTYTRKQETVGTSYVISVGRASMRLGARWTKKERLSRAINYACRMSGSGGL